jgi:hypothetical protein
MTWSAEKEIRDTSHYAEGSPTPSDGRGSDTPGAITMDDIIQQLLDARRMAQGKENKEEEKERKQKEERHREGIRRLRITVTISVLDIKSLQEAVPSWDSLQSSSQQSHENDEQELHDRLQEVQEEIAREFNHNPELEIFIAGDYNRHDII